MKTREIAEKLRECREKTDVNQKIDCTMELIAESFFAFNESKIELENKMGRALLLMAEASTSALDNKKLILDNKSAINSLENKILDNKSAINSLENKILDNKSAINSLENKILDNKDEILGLKMKVDTSVELIDRLKKLVKEGFERIEKGHGEIKDTLKDYHI